MSEFHDHSEPVVDPFVDYADIPDETGLPLIAGAGYGDVSTRAEDFATIIYPGDSDAPAPDEAWVLGKRVLPYRADEAVPFVAPDAEVATEPKPGFFQRVGRVWTGAKEDMKEHKAALWAALGLTLADIGYEVGPGNETAIPAIGRHILEYGHTGLQSAGEMLTGAGGFALVQQIAAGGLIAVATRAFPKTIKAANEVVVDNDLDTRKLKELPLGRQVFYSFFFGSGFNVGRESLKAGEEDFTKLMRVAGRSAVQTAAVVTAITVPADFAFDTWPGNRAVEFLVYDVVGNPYLTGAAATAALCYDGISGLIRSRRYNSSHLQAIEATATEEA